MTGNVPDFASAPGLSPFNSRSAALGADALFRRSLLAASADFSAVQDQIDCAELALALGEQDAARLIYDLVFLRLGFAPERLVHQRTLAERTGLWPAEQIAPGEREPALFSVDAALSELRGLLAIDLPELPEPRTAFVAPTFDRDLRIVRSSPDADLAGHVATLCALLRQPSADAALAPLLERLNTLVAGPLTVTDHMGGDIAALVGAFAHANLRDFLLTNHDIAFAPFGSATLFHAAARLDPGALGAWFGNLGNIIRSGRDVLPLIQLAAGDTAPVARWSVLLATNLPLQSKLELIDDLADNGMIAPIWSLLMSIGRCLSVRNARELLWRVRDAGLDALDQQLAIAAQRILAELALSNAVEWSILASIHATFDETDAAEALFARSLQLDPGDRGTALRLKAMRDGDFRDYAVTRGFSSSPARQRMRAARAHPPIDPLPAAA